MLHGVEKNGEILICLLKRMEKSPFFCSVLTLQIEKYKTVSENGDVSNFFVGKIDNNLLTGIGQK